MQRSFLVGLVALLVGVSFWASPAAEFASAQEVVKIAFLGPLTGPNAAQGQGARNAFDLAIKEANASGRFPFRIEAMILDDASDPSTGVAAALRAVNDPAVVAATGHWNSPVAMATIDVFHQHGIPMVIWGAIHPDITKQGYREVTRVAPTLEMENRAGAAWVMNDLGYKRWAVIYDTTTYGTGNRDAFLSAAEQHGAEIVSTDGISVGDRDFSALLTRIRGSNPEAVFFGGIVTEGALIKAQMTRLNLRAQFYSISGILDEQFNEVAGRAAEGTLSIKPGMDAGKLPGGQQFVEAYAAQNYREPFGAYGPYAYDSAGIILSAIEQVGPDPAAMVEAIRNISYPGILGVTEFDEDGQSKLVVTTRYVSQDGAWVEWDDSLYARGERSLAGR